MALITILRASTYRRARWKNGGGETMEVAIFPAGASLDRFDWRISVATIASDGPFSVFAGVDRTLCILDGGIRLHIDHEPARQLDDASEPFSFSGDARAHSTLIGAVAMDFNVMTRRDRFSHDVTRIRLRSGEARDLNPGVRAIFCQSGALSIEAAGRLPEHLGPFDTMLRDAPSGAAWRLSAGGAAVACLVTIAARR